MVEQHCWARHPALVYRRQEVENDGSVRLHPIALDQVGAVQSDAESLVPGPSYVDFL